MQDERRDILPQEMIRPTTFGSLGTLLVLAGILVVCANVIAANVLTRYPVNRGYALAYGKWTLMERTLAAKKKIDVLIVGDSSSNQGLNPSVIQNQTGLSAMNFGVVAEALTAEPVWAADRFLEQSAQYNATPQAILWMHVYDVWSRVDRNDRRLRGISAALPSTAWPYIERGPKVKISSRDLWLMQHVPLYFQNVSLSNLLRRPLASREEANRFKFDEVGFTAEATPDIELVRRDTRNHMSRARSDESVAFTTLSRRSIDTMAQLAAKHGVELWIVQSPLNRSIWQDAVFRERWLEVNDTLKKAAARYPHVRVMFDEPMLIDDGRMQNCDHVLADAADEFTREVIARAGLKGTSKQPATQRLQLGSE